MAHIVMAYTVMTYIVMAHTVMAHTVMAHIVMGMGIQTAVGQGRARPVIGLGARRHGKYYVCVQACV